MPTKSEEFNKILLENSKICKDNLEALYKTKCENKVLMCELWQEKKEYFTKMRHA